MKIGAWEKNLTPREKKLLKIAAIVFTLWLFYWILSPHIARLTHKKHKLTMAKMCLTVEENTYKNYNDNRGKEKEERAFLISKVPMKNPTSDFLVDLEAWSDGAQVQVESLDCIEASTEDQLSIKIQLRGELLSLLYVLEKLEGYPSAIDVDNIELKAITKANTNDEIPSDLLLSVPVTEDWELIIKIVLYYHEKLPKPI